jgi:hypothetical protein
MGGGADKPIKILSPENHPSAFCAKRKLWYWQRVGVDLCPITGLSRQVGRGENMKQNTHRLLMLIAIAVAAAAFVAVAAPAGAQQAAVAIDDDDIGGVVRGPSGPEAGVWVIAETTELPTKFTKIVVTDDQGRFVIPDLPRNVDYEVWFVGMGLLIPRSCAQRPVSSSI